MQAVIDWAKQIFVVCIFSEILINLVPAHKYREYVNFAATLLITIVCVNPLINLLTGSSSADELYDYFYGLAQIEELKNEINFDINEQEENSFEAYTKMVKKNIEQMAIEEQLYPVKTNIVIDFDKASESYCQLQLVSLDVKPDKSGAADLDSDSDSYYVSEASKRLRQKIADYYTINLSNVSIYIK